MLKCSSERWGCAPQSLSLGTPTSPRLSVSLRTPITDTLLIAAIVFDSFSTCFVRRCSCNLRLVNACPKAGVIDEFHAAGGTALRLTPRGATGVPIPEKHSESSSDRSFRTRIQRAADAIQKITPAPSLASSGVRVEIATQ